jgi:hypothetical protein
MRPELLESDVVVMAPGERVDGPEKACRAAGDALHPPDAVERVILTAPCAAHPSPSKRRELTRRMTRRRNRIDCITRVAAQRTASRRPWRTGASDAGVHAPRGRF